MGPLVSCLSGAWHNDNAMLQVIEIFDEDLNRDDYMGGCHVTESSLQRFFKIISIRQERLSCQH